MSYSHTKKTAIKYLAEGSIQVQTYFVAIQPLHLYTTIKLHA